MDDENELFADHRTAWPDEVGRKNAEFLDGKTLENSFDVFGIDVLPFLGDDHVFFATEELQVACGVEKSEVAGHKPAVTDRFRRDFRARFLKAVAVGHGDPEIVEKLKSLRFGERAAHNDGTEFPAKCLMNLFQKATADAEPWPAFCHGLVDGNKSIENFAFPRRQRIETRLQSFLQVFQYERHHTDISNLVFWKGLAHIFGTQRT